MKCPSCNQDGAYEPLMRPIECPNPQCSLFVHDIFGDTSICEDDVKVGYGTKPLWIGKTGGVGVKACGEGIKWRPEEMVGVPVRILKKLFITQTSFEWNNWNNNGNIRFVIEGYSDPQNPNGFNEMYEIMLNLFNQTPF